MCRTMTVLLLGFTGCGSNAASTKQIAELENTIRGLEQRIAQLEQKGVGIYLHDAEGRHRLEMSVSDRGNVWFALRDDTGRRRVSLEASRADRNGMVITNVLMADVASIQSELSCKGTVRAADFQTRKDRALQSPDGTPQGHRE